ncbi:phosphatidylinositol-binding protein scs2 [Ceratobasidium sp. 394]|nr:phosphatidylinositol-binding protein scs2 [Ceratobasidium sp. 394]
MSVQLSPSDQLQFTRPFTREVCCMLTAVNHNAQPVAFRVKTTAPKLYIVRPNSGRIEPGGSIDVQVLLQPMHQDPPLSEQCKDKFLVESVIISPNMEFRTAWHWWNFVVDNDKKAFQVYDQRIKVVHLPPESPIPQVADSSQANLMVDDGASFGLESLFLGTPSPRPPSPTLSPPAPEMDHSFLLQGLDTESGMSDVIQHVPSPTRSISLPLPSPSQTQEERSSSVPIMPAPGPSPIMPSTSSSNPLPAPRRERERERLPSPLRLPPPRSPWVREERVPNKEHPIKILREKGEEGLARTRVPRGRGFGFMRQRLERKPVPPPVTIAPSLSPAPPPQQERMEELPQSPGPEDPHGETTTTQHEVAEPLGERPLRQPDLEEIDAAIPPSSATPGSASTPDALATVVPSPVSPASFHPLRKMSSFPSPPSFTMENSVPDDGDDVLGSSPTSSPCFLSCPRLQAEWNPPVLAPPAPASPPISSVPSPPPQFERERERPQSPNEESLITGAIATHGETSLPPKAEPLHPHEVADIDLFMSSGPPTPDFILIPAPLVPIVPSLTLPTPSTPPQLRPFDLEHLEPDISGTERSLLDDLVCVPPVSTSPPSQLQTPERSPSVPAPHVSVPPVITPTRASTPSPPPRRGRERDRPLPSLPPPRIQERAVNKEGPNRAHAERRVGPSVGLRGRGEARGLGLGIGPGRGRERERGGRPMYVPRGRPGVGAQGVSTADLAPRPGPGPARLHHERERGRQLPTLRRSPSPRLRGLSEPVPIPADVASPPTVPSTPSPTPSPPPRSERSHSLNQMHATNGGIHLEQTIKPNVSDLNTITPHNLPASTLTLTHNSLSPAFVVSSPPSHEPLSHPQLEGERSQSSGQVRQEPTVTLVAYQATKDQNHPNGAETTKKLEANSQAPSVIGRATPLSVVISILVQHGCRDLTDTLDPSAQSQYPIAGGGFGDVYKGGLLGGTSIAIKCMRITADPYSDEDQKHLKSAAREIHAWSKLEHCYVSKFLGLALFRGNIAMISPWAERGSLPTYLAKRPSLNRPLLCTQIAEGLAFLHRSGVVSRIMKAVQVRSASNPTLNRYTVI